jgi:hypothetical protein
MINNKLRHTTSNIAKPGDSGYNGHFVSVLAFSLGITTALRKPGLAIFEECYAQAVGLNN